MRLRHELTYDAPPGAGTEAEHGVDVTDLKEGR
jgi:hypothetical protein